MAAAEVERAATIDTIKQQLINYDQRREETASDDDGRFSTLRPVAAEVWYSVDSGLQFDQEPEAGESHQTNPVQPYLQESAQQRKAHHPANTNSIINER